MLITREELALHRIFLDTTYPAKTFEYPAEEAGSVGVVRVQGAAELAGMDIRIHGRIGADAGAECARCTAPVTLAVQQEFDLLYRPVSAIAREEEIEIPRDELDVGFYSGEGVNLADVVKEQVILALPMKVLCRPDCRGLCPVCGVNLNTRVCRCPQPQSESAFGSLLRNSVRE